MRPATIVAAALLISSSSSAQTAAPAPQEATEVRYRASTIIEFTPSEIEGTVKGPAGFRIHQRKKVSFRSLVELRSDFRDVLSTTPAAL